MFGIDFETLIVLAVLAFILFGPEKLPEYAATLGKFLAKMRQASSEVTRQYQNPFQYPPEPTLPPVPESICSRCQQKVAAGLTFCPNCGQRLIEGHYPPPPASESTCPYCQQKVTPEFTFCPKCGHRLKEEHYPPPPQQSLAS